VRTLTYGRALCEGMMQAMEADESVYLIGQGVNSPWYVGATTKGIFDKFGPERVIDTPVSENGVTGIAIGSAMAGMKPVVIHPRMDFMLLAVEQLAGQAANWNYMFSGQVSVPVTIRSIVNRGGEQAAQHSQALQAMYAHIPGLKVVMPATARDAKGLLVAAIRDPNPVIFIDDRWLYDVEGDVPERLFAGEIGKAKVLRRGSHVSVAATSYMVQESLLAAEELALEGIGVEVVDVRTVRPLDEETILESIARTGHLVVADAAWSMCGVSAEIAAVAACRGLRDLRAPVERVTLPPCPAPMCKTHEAAYYPRARHVTAAVRAVLSEDSRRPIQTAAEPVDQARGSASRGMSAV
jgi:acetoin:2,6-dichlorophenolindophenol oxidoreductase subunit beta